MKTQKLRRFAIILTQANANNQTRTCVNSEKKDTFVSNKTHTHTHTNTQNKATS